MRDRNGTSITILVGFLQGDAALFVHELLRHLLTQIDRQEAFRELDSVELRPQSFQNLLPLPVTGETASGRTSDAMLAVQLDVERVECVATRRQCYPDGVVVRRFPASRVNVVLRFVEFKAYLGKIVQLGNGIPSDLGRYTAFKNAVQQRVYV